MNSEPRFIEDAHATLIQIGDVASWAQVACDAEADLDARIEAYSTIMDCEIGDTSLTRARHLERHFGMRQVYMKFEGSNPTGTQKDRIAFAQALDALRRGFDAICVATCGNYGVAIALAASLCKLRVVVMIPAGYQTKRLQEMTDQGVEVVRVPGDYEASVDASRSYAEEHGLYDANPGGLNTAIQLKAYGQIADEIYDDLRDAPAVVAVPVSNGTTLAGIYRGFVSLYRRGKTSRIPRFVAGSSYHKNPIIGAYLKGLERCQDLKPTTIKESRINEPLINWHSIDGNEALAAVRDTRGWASYATDKAMTQYARMMRQLEGLQVLPASTAGLIALISAHEKKPFESDRYVAILTGRGT